MARRTFNYYIKLLDALPNYVSSPGQLELAQSSIPYDYSKNWEAIVGFFNSHGNDIAHLVEGKLSAEHDNFIKLNSIVQKYCLSDLEVTNREWKNDKSQLIYLLRFSKGRRRPIFTRSGMVVVVGPLLVGCLLIFAEGKRDEMIQGKKDVVPPLTQPKTDSTYLTDRSSESKNIIIAGHLFIDSMPILNARFDFEKTSTYAVTDSSGHFFFSIKDSILYLPQKMSLKYGDIDTTLVLPSISKDTAIEIYLATKDYAAKESPKPKSMSKSSDVGLNDTGRGSVKAPGNSTPKGTNKRPKPYKLNNVWTTIEKGNEQVEDIRFHLDLELDNVRNTEWLLIFDFFTQQNAELRDYDPNRGTSYSDGMLHLQTRFLCDEDTFIRNDFSDNLDVPVTKFGPTPGEYYIKYKVYLCKTRNGTHYKELESEIQTLKIRVPTL